VRTLLAESSMEHGRTAEAVTQLELALSGVSPQDEGALRFSLGSAYARLQPPRIEEAKQNLTTFSKRICRGARASRFMTECVQTQDLLNRLGLPQ
jgi:hypothetical protein